MERVDYVDTFIAEFVSGGRRTESGGAITLTSAMRGSRRAKPERS